MSADRTYFRYMIAQYVHSRREERLNVGAVVHDPLRATIKSKFDTATAVRRIRSVFPDVDAKGVRIYLTDLSQALLAHEPLNDALDQPTALSEFGTTWRNAIQFTPVRSIPAANIAAALDTLMRLYVAEIPKELHKAPSAIGVRFARERTKQALKTVLRLDEGIGYTEFHEERSVWLKGKEWSYPIDFPFFVYDRYLIDTLSFKTDAVREKLDVVAGFLDKVRYIRGVHSGLLQPCVSYVPDHKKMDETSALVARIITDGEIPEDCVVDASEADKLARYIGQNRAA
jgi:hypothetical protein